MNRKIVYKVAIGIVMALYMVGCSPNSSMETNKENKNSTLNVDADNTKKKAVLNTYINSKYVFRISYPSNWGDFQESENGDGAIIYNKDDNDIRFYGSQIETGYESRLKNQVSTSGGTYKKFVFESGDKGMLFLDKVNNKQRVRALIVKNAVQYSFYALVTDKFFKENEEAIYNVAKSLVILDR